MSEISCLPVKRLVTYRTEGSDNRWLNAVKELTYLMKKKQNK